MVVVSGVLISAWASIYCGPVRYGEMRSGEGAYPKNTSVGMFAHGSCYTAERLPSHYQLAYRSTGYSHTHKTMIPSYRHGQLPPSRMLPNDLCKPLTHFTDHARILHLPLRGLLACLVR